MCGFVPLRPGPFKLLTETARRPGVAPRIPIGVLGGGRDTGEVRVDFVCEGPGIMGVTSRSPVDTERARGRTGTSDSCCGGLRGGGGGTALTG